MPFLNHKKPTKSGFIVVFLDKSGCSGIITRNQVTSTRGVLLDQGFTTRQVCSITGLSARQLGYWRKTGLLSPAQQTPGGHARYSFADLVSLKTASRLIDAGVSVQRIRQCLQSLSRFLPNTDTPLQELSLVATGDVVLVLRSGAVFDADWTGMDIPCGRPGTRSAAAVK